MWSMSVTSRRDKYKGDIYTINVHVYNYKGNNFECGFFNNWV